MAFIHANGDEEQRVRTPEEVAAIEEANRIAARSNIRSGEDRRMMIQHCLEGTERRLLQDRRSILSTFEREMLMRNTA